MPYLEADGDNFPFKRQTFIKVLVLHIYWSLYLNCFRCVYGCILQALSFTHIHPRAGFWHSWTLCDWNVGEKNSQIVWNSMKTETVSNQIFLFRLGIVNKCTCTKPQMHKIKHLQQQQQKLEVCMRDIFRFAV